MKRKNIFMMTVLILGLFIGSDFLEESSKNDEILSEGSLLKSHFINVEQGDSIFIELPNEKTILIDAGESSKGKVVSDYISNLGISKINYVIGTHPHTDHIGGLSYILENFEVDNIYMPKAISTSKTYENLLNTISSKKINATYAKEGVNIIQSDDLNVFFLAPSKEYSDLNNNSAVLKIVYKNTSFLFMGDAEVKSENDISGDVTADVIKVGHHGSDTSSGINFVNKVKPKYAIIMVKKDNQYNHPSLEIVKRWEKVGSLVYRTDINGNIIISSDGNNLVKELENENNN